MELCKWRRDPERDEDPREFPRFKKLVICVFVILAGTMSGLCSTIYFPSIPDIQEDLHASSIGVTLSTSLFILFTGFAPIVWSSISDYFHVRRLVYVSSLILFAISSLGCGFAQDIWTLVVLRCVQSVGASCAAVLGPGTISDLYPVEKRGAAMGILFLGYFGGPLMGPILGGIIAFYFSWRATFWFLVVYSSLICLGIFFFTVETYRPTDSPSSLPSPSPSSMSVELKERLVEEGNEDTKSEETKSEYTKNEDTKDEETKTDMESALITPEEKSEEKKSAPPPARFNPFLALIFLRHPFVLFTAFSTGVSFASMFTIETVLPDQFQETYHLNTLEIGLCFMGGGLGNVLGSFTGGRYLDYFLAKRARERGGKIVSEDRYPPTIFIHGFVTLPVGCILFVWAVEKHLPLPVPIFGFGLLCFAMSQILLSGSTYLVDATGKGASATAAANCARNVMAFILSLVASPIINYVGVGYVGIISAFLSILATCALLVNKVKGEQWRINGGFAHPR